MLNSCSNEPTRRRLGRWLDEGWLTATGLISLVQVLSWRELEVFLAWLSPAYEGSIEKISVELTLTPDTANTHLKNAPQDLEDAKLVSFSRGKAIRNEAFRWAVRSKVIDPYISV